MTINLKPFPKSYELYFGHPTPPYTHTHTFLHTHRHSKGTPVQDHVFILLLKQHCRCKNRHTCILHYMCLRDGLCFFIGIYIGIP